MKRAERRRRVSLDNLRGKIARFQIFEDAGLIDLIGRRDTACSALNALLDALDGDKPPGCGACGAGLTSSSPPYAWAVLQSEGKAAVCGLCLTCIETDPTTLPQAILARLGARALDPVHLHGREGRA